MERYIVHKLRESRGISLGSYKGYELKRMSDGDVQVYQRGKLVVTCDTENEAYEYIDDIPNRVKNAKPLQALQYCVKIMFPTQVQWFYLCNDGHYKRGSQVTKSDVRLFKSKNEAEQAMKYSTKSLVCREKVVELYR